VSKNITEHQICPRQMCFFIQAPNAPKPVFPPGLCWGAYDAPQQSPDAPQTSSRLGGVGTPPPYTLPP